MNEVVKEKVKEEKVLMLVRGQVRVILLGTSRDAHTLHRNCCEGSESRKP